jgi:polyisoprenoid-binding protein YceI
MIKRLTLPLFLLAGLPAWAQPPVFKISQTGSSIKFFVKASVSLTGDFKQWDATLAFTSTDPASGSLTLRCAAASVETGSNMKNGKLKGKDFFNAKVDPYITFKSTKFIQTGPTTFDIPGTFTIRGVSKPETLSLTVEGAGTGSGRIKGQMAFDRTQFGMDSSIPFIKIADRVEVNVDLAVTRTSGPPLVLKK